MCNVTTAKTATLRVWHDNCSTTLRMERLTTPQFGDIEFRTDQVIEFPAGLPAFEDLHKFLLLEYDGSAIGALQSIDRPEICFPILPMAAIAPSYELEIREEDRDRLRFDAENDAEVMTLAILTLTDSGPPTANLLAPILINAKKRCGIQTIRTDRRYSHCQALSVGKQPAETELIAAEPGESAC